MTNILPFSGNAHKGPQAAEYLTPHEAPIRQQIIEEGDLSLAAMYPHAMRAHEALRRQAESTASPATIAPVVELLQRAQSLREERGYDAQEAA